MKTTRITARFTGRDGSLGYTYGREYILTVWQHSEGGHRNIATETNPDEKYCEYSSIVSFLENWNNIQVID